MNRQIPLKVALPVIAGVFALFAFIYSRIPTGMVVHMTATNIGRGSGSRPGGMPMMRRPHGPGTMKSKLKPLASEAPEKGKKPVAQTHEPVGQTLMPRRVSQPRN